jgi:hypothetical protein
MPQPIGRSYSLSLPRRFMSDLVYFAQRTPLTSMQRHMNLAAVASARRAAAAPPGWCAIFTKAYSMVAARRPELRRAYVPFPWPRLYEHPLNIASVSVERQYGDEAGVFFAHVRGAEEQSLCKIERYLLRCKEGPIEQIGLFRRLLTYSRLPRPLRRFLWWLLHDTSGYRRVRHLGTFGISVVSNFGAVSLHLLSPVTTALNYGVVGADGSVQVNLTYDHRVLDGGDAARALEELEGVLKGEIVTELRYLEALAAA